MSGSTGRIRGRRALVALLGSLLGASACQEKTPTAPDEGLLPSEPVTVEIQIPWDEFGSDLAVYGGYGTAWQVGAGVVANNYAGTVNARTLAHFGSFPLEATVTDTTGTQRTDVDLTFVGGRLVARLDSASAVAPGPVSLSVGTLPQAFDERTASWTYAADSMGSQRPWDEAGGGPVTPLGTASWNPLIGDSVSFPLDSATVAEFGDTLTAHNGVRLDMETDDVRLEVKDMVLVLTTRPSVNPDTLIELTVNWDALSFIYDPPATPPADGMRVGGVPAWRTMLGVSVPTQIDGIPEVCAVVQCPVTLKPDQLSYAALLLTGRQSLPGYEPSDSVGLDVRAVLSPAALPKSPLSGSIIGPVGRQIPDEPFTSAPGTQVEVPITPYVRAQLTPLDPGASPPPRMLALLSPFEPVTFTFSSFEGPGGPGAPILKMIVTVGPPVQLP